MACDIEAQIERTSRYLRIFPKKGEDYIGMVTAEATGEYWTITDFVLSPEVRRIGLGSDLLQLMEQNIKDEGGKSLKIDLTDFSVDGIKLSSGLTELKKFLLRRGFTNSEEKPLLLSKGLNLEV